MEQEPTKTWEVSAFDRVNNEWTTTTNRAWDHTQELNPDLLVRQAPAIRVNPSKRKRPETEYDATVATIGDIHFPFQNQRRLELAITGLRALEPMQIDLLGDNLDSPNYSRFGTRKEWADATQQGIDQYAEFLGRLRADHPDAEITWHEGNHDQRQELRVREYNEDLLGIKRAGEAITALSLDFLLRLDELDIKFLNGYPSARRIVQDAKGNPQLEIFHGNITNGNFAASKVIQNAFTSFNTGHTHNFGLVSKTYWIGDEERVIYGGESGTFADHDKTPSGKYAPGTRARHNWQSGIIDWVVDEHGARPGISVITDHDITVRGKAYKS